jgi:nucleotide-binding universal stress UspA family protein
VYRNIIVGYDGSAQAKDALALGEVIADTTGASLTLAGVYHFSPRLGGLDPVLHDVEAAHIDELEETAATVGGRAEAVASSSPARGLHQLAEDTEADLVIVGSAHHGRLGQIVVGSVGVALLRGSPCPVAIAPRGYAERAPAGIAQVTVGFDGSPEANMALADALELARASNAPVRIVAVAEPPPITYGRGGGPNYSWHAFTDEIKGIMRERLDRAVASVSDDVRVEATLVEGHAESALAEIAVEDGGLLVLGSRAYGPLQRVLLASVSTELVRSTPCPVIVHPRPAHAEAPKPESAKAGSAA